MFVKISIDEYMKLNPDASKKDLKNALERKNNGAACIICGSLIWAAGSAAIGTDMCFTCMTGETDDSEDYEVE